ncbi:SgcJ/EcaC family oxidoreductase [Paludisphaera mucosa]|uniref:SgcJ/EcaC family oxidoreductase n=1 Tax=Paludisphaera mucosa TaxID=3030827 RepID=A0ABT6F4P3_9BACT|nr:SgcJ/EcaC family oxidoreductase [Paludisphaera mucosa]MDG3002553.1 SgcJ/EcaC family oxidoreductase [Paludisphaera mucosa]
MRPVPLWFGVAAFAMGQGVTAQEPAKAVQAAPAAVRTPAVAARAAAPATAQAADAKAIAALAEAYAKAFNAGDAEAAAATYAEDALVVDEDGDRTEGRAAIRDRLAAGFADAPGTTIAIATEALRFLGPDAALEEGRTTLTPAGAGESPETTNFTVVYVRRDGRWLQSAVRDEATHDLTPHDRLKELEWLTGDWVNESQDAVVATSCKWADDGNFLVREFTMKMQGRPVLSGTQRIGWDPIRRQFKTWVFDSAGGFGEGYWTRDGDRWVIKAEGVRQDGRHASVTNIITRLGKDRASWQSVDRTLGDAAVPGVDEFTIVRKPPEAGK